jgi:hypothetical protein
VLRRRQRPTPDTSRAELSITLAPTRPTRAHVKDDADDDGLYELRDEQKPTHMHRVPAANADADVLTPVKLGAAVSMSTSGSDDDGATRYSRGDHLA